jgi:integrase
MVRDRRGGRGLYPKQRESTALARRRELPEYLEAGEADALIRYAPQERARVIMLVQWRAGLRISEAVALEPRDLQILDVSQATLRVRHGKGNKARMVPVHPELRAALRTMIAFSGRTGRLVPVHRATAWRWVQEAQRRAVAAGALSPGRHIGTHTLRHSAARHWLASGVPINTVQRWLGHASLQTTLVYLQILPDPMGDIARVP